MNYKFDEIIEKIEEYKELNKTKMKLNNNQNTTLKEMKDISKLKENCFNHLKEFSDYILSENQSFCGKHKDLYDDDCIPFKYYSKPYSEKFRYDESKDVIVIKYSAKWMGTYSEGGGTLNNVWLVTREFMEGNFDKILFERKNVVLSKEKEKLEKTISIKTDELETLNDLLDDVRVKLIDHNK